MDRDTVSVGDERVGEKDGEKAGFMVEAGDEADEGTERAPCVLAVGAGVDRVPKKLFLLLIEACELSGCRSLVEFNHFPNLFPSPFSVEPFPFPFALGSRRLEPSLLGC